MPHRLKTWPPVLCCLILAFMCRGAEPSGLPERMMKLAAHDLSAADFIQTRHLEAMNMDVEIRGKMLSERGGRLRWQVDSPLRSVTLITRDKLTHFDRETGKLAVIDHRDLPWLEMLGECMDDWLSGDIRRLSKRFSVSGTGDGALMLVPKERVLKEFYRSIILKPTPDREHLERINIEENGGDKLEIRFLNVTHPAAVPDNAWRMPPE